MAAFVSSAGSGSPSCQASIEASMGFLNFDMGRLSVPTETSLFSLLGQCFARFTSIFNLEDPHGILTEPSTLERILSSVFDTASRAFVTERSPRILAGLDDRDKSCLYVQAVAGMVLIFRRLSSAGRELSASLLSRELQLFAESEQRQAVLEKIAGSHLLSSCYTKSAIVEFVVEVVEGRELGHYDTLPLNKAGEDLLSNSVTWVSDRPCKNMGLPWGFTIMTIN
ncbi:hypothetical protein MFIFM68171_08035 [Madurella fahalii]|uniref:Uncharacterized protein n=1 Tax=Madurella fahalii TaxID=1157608 RepID=A0ABQ0GJ86_9PEZI